MNDRQPPTPPPGRRPPRPAGRPTPPPGPGFSPLSGPVGDRPPLAGNRGDVPGQPVRRGPQHIPPRHGGGYPPPPQQGTPPRANPQRMTPQGPSTPGPGDRPGPGAVQERPVAASVAAEKEAEAAKATSDSSILRTSGSIAIATLMSRITGFIRTVLVLAMLGAAVSSAFQAAYVLPNMVAEVVLGAVLTAIVIPVLVRAEAEDADGGATFINRIFTLTVTLLGAATILALVGAPVLTYLNVGDGDVNRSLATALAYLLLPEILFYGLSALFMAILNVKGYFKPGAWAPVLNNFVQIATLIIYAALPGDITLNPVRMSNPQILVLGIGTTIGVIVQVAVLVPYLKRAGVKLRWVWGIDDRLRRFGNMALAVIVYVAILQVGLIITYRIAASAADSGISVYATHWQLLQLPYGVLGVTILTAIMPRLSRNAASNDTNSVIDDLSLATRLTMVALVPVVAFMTFFGPAIGVAVFNFGQFDAAVASQLGSVLAWGAFTLIPYAMTLVQLRVFYAREDAWAPTLMVLGITAIKVVLSYLGPVIFDDPDLVVRWLALSNGAGYLIGAIVGHFLLKKRLGNIAMTNVTRTSVLAIVVSVAAAGVTYLLADVSGLHRLAGDSGKVGAVVYLMLTAIVALGLSYAGLAALKVPDVVAITVSVRRMLGRFIPALAPASVPEPESTAAMTIQFPRISTEESVPYSGQVQVLRRFDRGTSTWESYSVHSGGAAGTGALRMAPQQGISRPPDMRYRRRGVRGMSDGDVETVNDNETVSSSNDAAPENPGPAATSAGAPQSDASRSTAPESGSPTPGAPAGDGADRGGRSTAGPHGGPPRPRGPRLVPGAAVAGGRYRLLDHHGGTRGLQFWRALDINLDRDVALTFVDAEQLSTPPTPGAPKEAREEGPQAVLSRTLRLGHVNSSGVARVLDVVRGSSGGIVVTEWVPGSSLREVAESNPSPVGAARAVRALAAAAESAHRNGGALSIDHPDRIRISTDGNAVLAFPGTLVADGKASDVRGLGAVLYALLLARWPLDGETGSKIVTTNDKQGPVGGLPPAIPDSSGKPVEPREARSDVPFEISAVAARALDGDRGIRTAGTVQHVLDQATVVDLKTDMLPAVEGGPEPVTVTRPDRLSPGRDTEEPERRRNVGLIVGAALLSLFIVIALIVWLSNALGGSSGPSDIDTIITTSTSGQAQQSSTGPISLTSVTVVDFSDQTPDPSTNVSNVISGQRPAWRTDNYRSSSNFGGLKQGLGLMFNLGGSKTVKTVTIRTSTPGFNVQLRTAPSPSATLGETKVVGSGDVISTTTNLPVPDAAASPYFLVWITDLPSGPDGGYQAVINQVSMTG